MVLVRSFFLSFFLSFLSTAHAEQMWYMSILQRTTFKHRNRRTHYIFDFFCLLPSTWLLIMNINKPLFKIIVWKRLWCCMFFHLLHALYKWAKRHFTCHWNSTKEKDLDISNWQICGKSLNVGNCNKKLCNFAKKERYNVAWLPPRINIFISYFQFYRVQYSL